MAERSEGSPRASWLSAEPCTWTLAQDVAFAAIVVAVMLAIPRVMGLVAVMLP